MVPNSTRVEKRGSFFYIFADVYEKSYLFLFNNVGLLRYISV